MVHFGTPNLGPFHIPNIGPIGEGLIPISAISYDGTTTKYFRCNGVWSISGPQGFVLSTTPISDPSMQDWYQYLPWNLIHWCLFRKSRPMTYHTTAQLWNCCGPMADGPFRNPKGQSHRHPEYWTYWWRIDINISHGISRIGVSQENQDT